MTDPVSLVMNNPVLLIGMVGSGLVLALCAAKVVRRVIAIRTSKNAVDAVAPSATRLVRGHPASVTSSAPPDFHHPVDPSRSSTGQMAHDTPSHPEAIGPIKIFEVQPTAAPWRARPTHSITPLVPPPETGPPTDGLAANGTDARAGAAGFLKGSPAPDPQLIAHVIAMSEFEMSERRSRPAPRLTPSPSGNSAAEFAQLFCEWLIASGASGREFAHEDMFRLAIRFAGLAGVPLPQPDEEFFQALSEVRGVDKKPHRPCRVRDRQQTATTTYTVYAENEVRLIQRSHRPPRRARADAAARRSGRAG